MSNQKFTNACAGRPQSTPPIWMMRQAGRYHHHYQKLRAQHSFMELCKRPRLAAEVTLGPIADFDFDVAIIFSDLLFPLEAMGMGLKYDPAPELGWALDRDSIHKLRRPDQAISDLLFQGEAIRETRKILPLDKSLIGFVGGPWTLFAYAVDGSHSGGLSKSKLDLELFKSFSEYIVPLLKQNIAIQLQSGCEIVMIFDTAAGELCAEDFRHFVEPTLTQLISAHPGKLGYYAKGVVADHIEGIQKNAAWAGIGYDHRWRLSEVLKSRKTGFVQGNFDQSLLFAQPKEFEKLLAGYLEPIKNLTGEQRSGWVCGLGHGVLPGTPEANVRRFVKMVREEMNG